MRTKKRRIYNKKSWTNRCCTLVVARLSSSYLRQKSSLERYFYCLWLCLSDSLPASLMTGKAPGGTSRKFGGGGGFGRKFPERGPVFLEVALVWKFPYGIPAKQTSKNFASEPRKLLRSLSRSGSMRKLVLRLSQSIL